MLKTQYLYDLEKEIKPYLNEVFNSDPRINEAKTNFELAGIYKTTEGVEQIVKVTETTISIEQKVEDKTILLEKIFFNINCAV